MNRLPSCILHQGSKSQHQLIFLTVKEVTCNRCRTFLVSIVHFTFKLSQKSRWSLGLQGVSFLFQ